MKSRIALGIAALAAVGVVSACLGSAPRQTVRPSVILVSIDTLRADHVSVRGLTPALDALAKNAVRFSSAWSHAPLTLPAHASMMTGLLPTRHGVRDNVGFEVRGSETLAEKFKRSGYVTGGFVSSTVLRRETGIARGFDVYDDRMPEGAAGPGLERSAAATVEQALRFVAANRTTPFFLFVHFYEPHTPYAAPPAFDTRGTSAYDREVAAADAALGTLLDGLSGNGVVRPAIVVTSDHGEGLGDHGELEHGLLLYAEALRVPLIIARPDGTGAGTEVGATVRQIDIAPTLLNLAGLDASNMDGAPLGATVSGGARVAYSETWYPKLHFGWSELTSAAEGRWHYISGPRPELYDLEADPRETTDLAADPARPGAAMARYLSEQRAGAAAAAEGRTSGEAEERLKALGYLGVTRFSEKTVGANPRDKLGFYQPFMSAFTEAHAARARGDFPRAAEEYRRAISLLRMERGLIVPKLHFGLADSLARMGRAREAEKAFKAELALDSTSVETRAGLGALYWSQSQDARARDVISGIVTANPKAGAAEYASVIRTFEGLGDTESVAIWRERAKSAGHQ
jgi:arylsulfatase A-like enzyme